VSAQHRFSSSNGRVHDDMWTTSHTWHVTLPRLVSKLDRDDKADDDTHTILMAIFHVG